MSIEAFEQSVLSRDILGAILAIRDIENLDIAYNTLENMTLLNYALQAGQVEIAQHLLDCGAGVNAVNADKTSPLHMSALRGQKEMCILLIKAGADVNAKDDEEWTPLHAAALGEDIGVYSALLNAGADVHSENADLCTPLHCLARVMNDRADICELLLKFGANVNALDTKKENPLHEASFYNLTNMATTLLNAGADLHQENEQGRTPINLAKSPEMTALLTKHKEDL